MLAKDARTRFQRIIQSVETDLVSFYGFQLQTSAMHHVMDREQSESLWRWRGANKHRAAVYFTVDPQQDELFIGIHFAESIIKTLCSQDPCQRLDHNNLDAFCVLVEELSHFHLIVNRAASERQVTELELEWQGEIDKLLVCAMTLSRQYADPHYLALARALYDRAQITGARQTLYWNATKYAAQFWYAAIRRDLNSDPRHSPYLREILRHCYTVGWQAKIESISSSMAA